MYSMLPAFVAIYSAMTAIAVYVSNRTSKVNITFVFFCLCTCMWQGTWAVLFLTKSPTFSEYLIRQGYFFIIFLPTFMYHFLANFSDYNRSNESKFIFTSYLIDIVFVLLLPTHLFISGYYSYEWGHYPTAGIIHPFHVIQTIIVVNRGLYLVLRKYLSENKGPYKQSLGITLIGLLVYFFAAVDYLCNYGFSFYPPGIIFIFVAHNFMAYTMIKHNLMSFKVVITKGLSYVLTTTLFISVFLFLNFSLKYASVFTQKIINIIYFIFAAISALSFNFFRELVYFPMEKRLLKGFYDIQKIINSMSNELIIVQDHYEVLSTVSRTLQSELETHDNYFIFSGIGEDTFHLYHHDQEESMLIIDSKHELLTFFQDHYDPVRVNESKIDITKMLRPLKITEKSLIFPIHSIGKYHGVFIVGEKRNGKLFTDGDLQLVESIINQLKVVFDKISYQQKLSIKNEELEKIVDEQVKEIESKKKMERDAKTAQMIQKKMLPKSVPLISNFKIDVLYEPALYLSGDYYDFLVFDDENVFVVIGDGIGKGIAPAMEMAILKVLLHERVKKDDKPGQVLTSLNVSLYENDTFYRYAALSIVKVNPKTGEILYSNAGLPPLWHLSKEGIKKFDETECEELGANKNTIYADVVIQLKSGESIMLHTDGLNEARNEKRDFLGDDLIAKTLQKHSANEGINLMETIKEVWMKYRDKNGQLHDDTTIVTLYFNNDLKMS